MVCLKEAFVYAQRNTLTHTHTPVLRQNKSSLTIESSPSCLNSYKYLAILLFPTTIFFHQKLHHLYIEIVVWASSRLHDFVFANSITDCTSKRTVRGFRITKCCFPVTEIRWRRKKRVNSAAAANRRK